MKPKYIIPCVCIDHEPNASDSIHYGMPQLDVAQSVFPYKQFWYISCHNCGRGSRLIEFNTAHQALKEWNKIQAFCWSEEIRGFSKEPKNDAPEWKVQMFKKYFREDSEEE